jgi:hypothetical protein
MVAIWLLRTRLIGPCFVSMSLGLAHQFVPVMCTLWVPFPGIDPAALLDFALARNNNCRNQHASHSHSDPYSKASLMGLLDHLGHLTAYSHIAFISHQIPLVKYEVYTSLRIGAVVASSQTVLHINTSHRAP